MHSTKICLNMIVKNESHIIVDTLNKLINKIKFDFYVICDTGSSDNTINLIVDFFKNQNIKGEIYSHVWKNFGYNRTLALECAKNKSDYVFIFDADDYITGDIDISNLTEDAYFLKFGNENISYNRMCLVKNNIKWEYIGVLHEYISTKEKYSSKTLKGNYQIISGRTSSRNNDPNKYLNDAMILSKGYAESIELKDGLHHRYAYYCANSYYDAKKTELAIEWYLKTLQCNGWVDEKYNACLKLYELIKHEGRFYYLVKSHTFNSRRVEGIFLLIQNYAIENNYQIAFNYYKLIQNYYENEFLSDDLSTKLFAKVMDYNFNLAYYMIIVCEKIKQFDIGVKMYHIIFEKLSSPGTWWVNNLIFNFQFYLEYTNESIIFKFEKYIETIKIPDSSFKSLFNAVDKKINSNLNSNLICLWKILHKRIKSELIKYNPFKTNILSEIKTVMTFTTCKRLDLFIQTINSVINNFTDLHLVDYFICIDDNSSEADREIMKHDYPFINYYFKTEFEKGHYSSMNILLDKLNELNPDYWIHIEDDFLFHKSMDYITSAIKGLDVLKEENVKQILFNKNYTETIDGINIDSHKKFNEDYCIHIHKHGTFNKPNCYYWPHFSFRPSLIDFKTIKSLGYFENKPFFEMEYAKKWTLSGYCSGFFNSITCTHIGKLTSEKDKSNAYNLNEVSQFHKNSNLIKIVNLKRRPDRKEKIIDLLKEQGIYDYDFVEAVDGKELKPTKELWDMFKGNDFNYRCGFIGCALSHLNLWKELVNSNKNYYIIMEDDITFCNDFKNKLNTINFNDKDLVFLGYHMFKKDRKGYSEELKPLDKHLYIGGTFGYIINKTGAQKMIDFIEINGIKHGIDYLIKINNNINCYSIDLIYSEWNEDNKIIDTDIQSNFSRLDFSNSKILEDQFEFIQGLDQLANDMYKYTGNTFELMDLALNDPKCFSFNTLGFYKNKGDINFIPSIYFKETDGIYIKKEQFYSFLSFNKTIKSRVCFIHSCYIDSISILENLINKIKEIEDHFDYIYIINIGKKLELKLNDKWIIINFSTETTLYENKTLNVLHTFCQLNPNIDVLYLHTKVISYKENTIVKNWVNLMLCFLLKKNTFDTDVNGCNYQELPKKHFSGNFWWAKSNYISTLNKITTTDKLNAKFWLFSGNPTYSSLHNSGLN